MGFVGIPVTSSSVMNTIPGSKAVSFQSGMKIDRLCETLRHPQDKLCCLGYLEAQQMWHHQILNASTWTQVSDQRQATTLKEALYRRNAPLATTDKYRLALSLASSLVQLHSTPWLGRSLDLNDVRLISSSGASTTTGTLYISRIFDAISCSQTPPTSKALIKNEGVFALGVALLELSYGQSLLSLKTEEDPDPIAGMSIFTTYSIACRLVEELEYREGHKYASATKRCILFRFDTTNSISLDDVIFQQLFFQGVVEPLQQVYDFATKGV